jgi:hypothetical protein
MSTYTVSAAAGKAQPVVPTPVPCPSQVVAGAGPGGFVPAPGSFVTILPLRPGVVLDPDIGAYLAALYPTLITVA